MRDHALKTIKQPCNLFNVHFYIGQIERQNRTELDRKLIHILKRHQNKHFSLLEGTFLSCKYDDISSMQ